MLSWVEGRREGGRERDPCPNDLSLAGLRREGHISLLEPSRVWGQALENKQGRKTLLSLGVGKCVSWHQGSKEQHNAYLMTFLGQQPPCQSRRLEQSLALGQTEDVAKSVEPAREARMVPREWLDSKVRRLIKVTVTISILSKSTKFPQVRLWKRRGSC